MMILIEHILSSFLFAGAIISTNPMTMKVIQNLYKLTYKKKQMVHSSFAQIAFLGELIRLNRFNKLIQSIAVPNIFPSVTAKRRFKVSNVSEAVILASQNNAIKRRPKNTS